MIDSDAYEASSLLVGTVLSDRFELLELVGCGGAGSVYRARDLILSGRSVAVKVLHQQFDLSDNIAQRFFREVELMHQVNHPNVVRTFDVGQDKGTFYFSMEYLEGVSLQDAIDDGSSVRLNLDSLIFQIVEGLTAIHNCGIIHRDLKPGNILLLPDDTIKITDFGIARGKDSRVTRDNQLLGSMGYMAPEAWSGKSVTASVDLYSLGVILYEVVTGRLPFDKDEMAHLMYHHLNTVPEPVSVFCPELPAWVVELVSDLMKKKPEERPASAQDVKKYLPSCRNASKEIVEVDLLDSLRPGYSPSKDIAIPSSNGSAFDSLIFAESSSSPTKSAGALLRQDERPLFESRRNEVARYEASGGQTQAKGSNKVKVLFLSTSVVAGIIAVAFLYMQMNMRSKPLQTYEQVTGERRTQAMEPSTHTLDAAHDRHIAQLQRIKSIILSLEQPSLLNPQNITAGAQRFGNSTSGRGEIHQILQASQSLIDEFSYFYPFGVKDLASVAEYELTPAMRNAVFAKEMYRKEILDLEFILQMQSYRTGDLLRQGRARLERRLAALKAAKTSALNVRRRLIEDFGTWEMRLYGAARDGLKSIAVPVSQENRDIRAALDVFTRASDKYNKLIGEGAATTNEGKAVLKEAQRAKQMKLNALERKIFQKAEERYIGHVLSLANLLLFDELVDKHIEMRQNHARQLTSFAESPKFLSEEESALVAQKLKESETRLREDSKTLGSKQETWVRVEIASSSIRDLLGQ